MKRKIITIDKAACNGCGLCAAACHEGAIGMENGKAVLLRDDYCDGLGDCLPVCPTGAIAFEEREAAPYDEAAVKARMAANATGGQAAAAAPKAAHTPPAPKTAPAGSCPGDVGRALPRPNGQSSGGCPGKMAHAIVRPAPAPTAGQSPAEGNAGSAVPPAAQSQLAQWPVQIKLAPPNAPYFEGARLLIAADCTAYAYAAFHQEYMKGRVTLIGCPKLDEGDYAEKLGEILRQNNIKSVTVARMEVPCCGGLERAAMAALQNSGKMIPWQVVTFSTDGHVLEGAL